MPIPTPKQGESQNDFIERCMSNPSMIEEFPEQKQRTGVCFSQFRKKDLQEKSIIQDTTVEEISQEEVFDGTSKAISQGDIFGGIEPQDAEDILRESVKDATS